MSIFKRQRRANGTIDKLKPELKDTVDQMLLSGESYREIIQYLSQNEVALSQASVSRYAQRFLATAQQIRVAQENFKMILTETERYPDLDPAEAILRLSSQKILDQLSQIEDNSFAEMTTDDLLKLSVAVSRAAVYKKKSDTAVKSDRLKALDENQTLLYKEIKKNNPKLYADLENEIRKLREKEKAGDVNA